MALIIESISSRDGIQSENVRPEVAKFAVCMEQILQTKDQKYGGCNYSLDELIKHLEDEITELKNEIDQASHECIDVANMCMMVHDHMIAIMRFKGDTHESSTGAKSGSCPHCSHSTHR